MKEQVKETQKEVDLIADIQAGKGQTQQDMRQVLKLWIREEQ